MLYPLYLPQKIWCQLVVSFSFVCFWWLNPNRLFQKFAEYFIFIFFLFYKFYISFSFSRAPTTTTIFGVTTDHTHCHHPFFLFFFQFFPFLFLFCHFFSIFSGCTTDDDDGKQSRNSEIDETDSLLRTVSPTVTMVTIDESMVSECSDQDISGYKNI